MSLLPDPPAGGRPPVKFEITLRKRRISDEELIEDLRRVARDGKGVATAVAYTAAGEFHHSTVLCRFGSWNGGLKAAGLPINLHRNVPDRELFENLAEVWRKLGRQPAMRNLTKRDGFSRFSVSTYRVRFGTWHRTLQAFADFVNAAAGSDGASVREAAKPSLGDRRHSPRKISWRLRATVLIRDNCLCRMCGASPAKDPAVTLHVDHIVPWSKGGETHENNLQSLCSVCNIGKGDLS